MAEETKRCGECAYWMTPRCTYFEDAKKGIVRSTDFVCGDFYPLPRRKKEKKKKEQHPPRKTCGIAEEGPFEAIYYEGKPPFW